jgi:hypothetical protein
MKKVGVPFPFWEIAKVIIVVEEASLSWKATVYVKGLGSDRVTRAEKLLLFVLADQYLDDRRQAWNQSLEELSRAALMSKRQGRRSLRSLEQKGILFTVLQPGRQHTNIYRFPEMEKGDRLAPFNELRKGDITGRKRGHHGSEKVVKGDIAMSAPIRKNRQRTDKETDKESSSSAVVAKDPTTTSSNNRVPAEVIEALTVWCRVPPHEFFFDYDAIKQLWFACRAQSPGCTAAEVIEAFTVKFHQGWRGGETRIRNMSGFLLAAVPKCFAAKRLER